MSAVATQPSLKSLFEQLERAQQAYCNGAPPYTITRMRSLIAQMRIGLDDIEQILDECEFADAAKKQEVTV